jgi:cystathionine beta-lyase/cystathionine gamma-synthase
MPIFQTTTYEYVGGEGGYGDLPYHRLNNSPNPRVVQAKLAAIEGAESGLMTASGMAAIATTLLTFLSEGDHLLIHEVVYGGTHGLVTAHLHRFGISFDFVSASDPGDWEKRRRPNTKAIYVETIANPLMTVPDLGAVVAFARRHGILSIIDNTFASPINFRAAAAGFDISIHSATKYIAGHNDVVAGVLLGRASLVEQARRLLNLLGGCLDPHACFLVHRGLKTLAVRVRAQNRTGAVLSEFLEGHEAVSRVYYPGLPRHETHANAKAYLEGYGGMISFETRGGAPAAERFVRALHLGVEAPSLGGVETLVSRPALLSHADLNAGERERMGIRDSLIRVSVGLESAVDLVEDFRQALEA